MKIRINIILALLLCFNAMLLFLIADAAAGISEEKNTEEVVCACDINQEVECEKLAKAIEGKPIVDSKSYTVPKNSGFKSYMHYEAITNTNSKQYKLQKEYAYTGNYGIRMVNGRYCIALGSHFTTKIGQYVDLILENGTVIPCVLADGKADKHTDEQNIVTIHNGCVAEFVVSSSLEPKAKKRGDVSYCDEAWESPVAEVVVYDKNVFK